tara:strand:+ start:8728 stop:9555 length:828 start_codon:yes stop_codon:yes gene_type:complete
MTENLLFTFASSEVNPISRAFIRLTELSTGQPKLKKIYDQYIEDDRPPELFWHDAIKRLNLKIKIKSNDLDTIPKKGRLLIVSNHPFGVIDGLTICSLVTKIRQDVKLMTHKVLAQAPAVRHQILPIDFSNNKPALINNINTRRLAEKHLMNEGVVIMFPSGEIATAKKLKEKALEKEWKLYASKLSLKWNTPVLPMFFEGQNSSIFHIANKIGQTFKYSVLMYELCKKIGSDVNVHIGNLISYNKIKSIGDLKQITKYLYDQTYDLDPDNKFFN